MASVGIDHALRLLAVAVSLIPAVAKAVDEGPWTLERCLEEAHRRSPRLQASLHSVTAAQSRARSTLNERFGTVDLGAGYTYTSEVMQMELNLPPMPGYTPPLIRFGDQNAYDLALAARVPVYSGGTLTERVRAAECGLEAAQMELRADSTALAFEVRRAYFRVLGGQARVEAMDNRFQRLNRHLDELRQSREVGMASEEAVVTMDVGLKGAEAAQVAIEAEARAARLTLGDLVGCPGEEVTPDGDLDRSLVVPEELDAGMCLVRAEVSALDAGIERLDHIARIAAGGGLPMAAAMASYHYGRPGVDRLRNEWMGYGVAGVTMSWNLWDWRARRLAVESSKAEARVLEARKHRLCDGFRTAFAAAQVQLTAAKSSRDKAAERLDLQRRKLELVLGRYRQGMATASELLDAEDDLNAVEIELVSAKVNLRLAEAQLMHATGIR